MPLCRKQEKRTILGATLGCRRLPTHNTGVSRTFMSRSPHIYADSRLASKPGRIVLYSAASPTSKPSIKPEPFHHANTGVANPVRGCLRLKLILDPASSKPQLCALTPDPPPSPLPTQQHVPTSAHSTTRPHSVGNEHRTYLSEPQQHGPSYRQLRSSSFVPVATCHTHTWSVPVSVSPRYFVFFLLSRHALHDDEQLPARLVKRASSLL